MVLANFGILLLTLSCIKAETWKLPTVADIQTSLDACQITNLMFLNQRSYHSSYSFVANSDLRCFTQKLGLWSDDDGFKTQRFMKVFSKHHQPIEISVVIDYCNKLHKQTADLDRWANEAFNCFAKGRLGVWMEEFIRNIYKKKITNE